MLLSILRDILNTELMQSTKKCVTHHDRHQDKVSQEVQKLREVGLTLKHKMTFWSSSQRVVAYAITTAFKWGLFTASSMWKHFRMLLSIIIKYTCTVVLLSRGKCVANSKMRAPDQAGVRREVLEITDCYHTTWTTSKQRKKMSRNHNMPFWSSQSVTKFSVTTDFKWDS